MSFGSQVLTYNGEFITTGIARAASGPCIRAETRKFSCISWAQGAACLDAVECLRSLVGTRTSGVFAGGDRLDQAAYTSSSTIAFARIKALLVLGQPQIDAVGADYLFTDTFGAETIYGGSRNYRGHTLTWTRAESARAYCSPARSCGAAPMTPCTSSMLAARVVGAHLVGCAGRVFLSGASTRRSPLFI